MRLTLLTAGQKRFKAAFYLAFGGITVILALAVGLALYAFAQLGQTVERTTREILPETLAALRLSERSALLAALAPTLANAGDHAQLQQLAAQLEGLIAEIPKHISQLKVWIEPNASAILRDRVAFLATTLRMLREANADRITLEQRQRALLAEIGRVHSELNDTVGPVVYGVTSLNQVLAKRDVRRQISTLRELWEHHNRQYTAVVSLRLLLDALKTTPSKIQQNGSSSAAMRELTRGALAELQVTHHAEQAPEVARLSAVVGQWLQREPPQWPNAALQQELITALEQFLEQIEGYLAKHMQESLEQIQTNLLTLLEQRGRNLIYALDIRGEGNLLFAMLTTAAETRGAEHLALLQERFNRAQELFRFAATAFRTSELAQRNPVLADNMHNIEQALARFGEGDTNVFAVRQQIRDLEDRIEHLLADSRRIAKAVTDQSDVLVRRVQVETNALQTAQIAQQRTLEWGLLWVCGGGVLLAGLIVWSTGRILDRHERDLHAARVAADRASEAKSRFLANMSHEIRTPMNGVLGMLQLLEKTALDGRQRDYLTTACGSAGMLLTVINDILDVSKMEAGRLRLEIIVFDLRQQITELIELLRREALRKGLHLTSVVPEQAPRQVRGDPVRLHQVLMNLLGNAIKFTEQGEVALRVEPVDQGRLRFVIRDTGIGMTEAEQAQVFDAFVQADGRTTRRFGGTGLGLTISRQLVELMGGVLAVRSIPGQGSEFSFVLQLEASAPPVSEPGDCGLEQQPVEPSAVSQAALASTNAQAEWRHQGRRVLLVEDNLVNQLLCQEMLAQLGLSVTVANNGWEALAALADQSYDLVLMDCQMPEMDGYEATRAIRSREREQNREILPIIALTAHAMPGDREKCLEAGMDDYLMKPFHEQELIALLVRWL